MTAVALLGYGRFGRAIASLISAAGLDHRAFDTLAEIPPAHRAGSLPELVAGVDLVMVAVPVPQLAEALRALKPHLSARHTVFDVGSVKVKPAEVLSQVLGRDVPWAGSHPLFGPTSLTAKKRALKTVVCPSPDHPAAAEKVASLYRQLGCEVIQQSADAHDRAMAMTQALTYFLAEGVSRLCSGMEVPFAPPSFMTLWGLAESVRADGPALFSVVQNENPHAKGVRKRLIEALRGLDESLDSEEQ